MRRTSLTTLLLATALSGIAYESNRAAFATKAGFGRPGRGKSHSPKPSRFEKDALRPATLNALRHAGKISPATFAAMTRGAK
jgi:hypothetical protein